MKVSYFNFPK